MGFVTKEKFLSKDFFITYAWLLGGCFVFALGAVMFAEPYGFAPGGTYGLSMVFHHLWGWETEIAALCMDVPLLLLGIYFLGGMLSVRSLFRHLCVSSTIYTAMMPCWSPVLRIVRY